MFIPFQKQTRRINKQNTLKSDDIEIKIKKIRRTTKMLIIFFALYFWVGKNHFPYLSL